MLVFLTVTIGFGALLSASSSLLDQMSLHAYPQARRMSMLPLAVVAEHLVPTVERS